MDNLTENLHYNPTTGEFTRKRATKSALVGKRAGCLHKSGYRHIFVRGMGEVKEHRLAFLFMGQPMPEEVDHINGRKDDNRWCNLRSADRIVNLHNMPLRKDNPTGYPGVTPTKTGFVARFQYKKKPVHIGTFRTPEEAHAAYLETKRKYTGETL